MKGTQSGLAGNWRDSKRISAEEGRRDDPRTPKTAALQQSGVVVAGYKIVGLASQGYRQQECIVRIVGLDGPPAKAVMYLV